jgi:hypothetical protein
MLGKAGEKMGLPVLREPVQLLHSFGASLCVPTSVCP